MGGSPITSYGKPIGPFFSFTLAKLFSRLSGRMGNPSLSFLLAKETWCRGKESNLHGLAVTGF
jgi:hypothetical protein